MPMGVVSDEDFELESSNNCIIPNGSGDSSNPPVSDIVENTPGRKVGDNNVPDSLRKIIAETSVMEGRQAALRLASNFGISASSVSAYARGSTSTVNPKGSASDISNYIRSRKERLTKRALQRLGSALHYITDEKLTNVNAKDCAAIAKDMSAIVKNFDPSRDDLPTNQQNNQFIFYTPVTIPEEKYEVIDATKE